MTTDDAVDQWLAYLAQRGRSATTIRTYRSTMESLPGALAATREEVEAWWDSLDALSPRTRTRALSCLRSFYRWAARFDLRADDPTRRLDPPKVGKRLPRPMGRAEMLRVMDSAPPDVRRAVALGGYAGLRVAEAAALDWRDVDVEARRIYVRGGKGDKDRAVGLSPLLLDELLPETGGNVVTAGGAPYSADALQRRCNRAIRAAGVDGTFHKLRSRFATVALASTGNLLAVSRALGHSSPSVTAIYAATSDADLDLIAEAAARG